MAKKPISKHSRAARRSEAFEPEAKALESLPRTDKSDFEASLIRTANKNEQLLEAKLNKRKNKTGRVGKKQIDSGSANKNKTIRAFNINSRLDGKIEKAVNRARYVQSARKAGWETTNSNIRKELDVLQGKTTDDKDAGDEKEVDLMDNDEEEPYSSANLESTVTPVPKETVNAFAALDDEVEA